MNRKFVLIGLILVVVFMLAVARIAPRDVDGSTWHPTPTVTATRQPLHHPDDGLNDWGAQRLTNAPTQDGFPEFHRITTTPDGNATPTLMFSYP